MPISRDVADAMGKVVAGFNAAFDEEKAHLRRRFTEKNGDGENVLLLDYTSQWTIKGNPEMHVIGDKRIPGYEITGDAVDRFAELERSAPRWISIKDRLPEPQKEILLAVPMFGKPRIRVGVLAGDRKTWILLGTVDPAFPPIPPTHWMELPAPPDAAE